MSTSPENNKHVIIIGGGIGGLSSACYLARAGYRVSLYEKNDHVGGRASLLKKDGYTWDMGPSWYLMPDVFEKFFNDMEENIDDYLTLTKLDPSYRIFFTPQGSIVDVCADEERDIATFEKLEPGVTARFREYLRRASYQYTIALDKFVYKNYDSFLDFFKLDVAIQGMKLNVFQRMSSYVKKFFHTDEMQKIASYPLLFLGTAPSDAIAIYSIMSHVDFKQGVRYPQGGLYEIIRALVKIAQKHGVEIHTSSPVSAINVEGKRTTGITLSSGDIVAADIVISNADMPFTETRLLASEHQTYPASYREKKTIAPSSFILYLGIDGKLPMLTHHNLIFTKDRDKNFAEIFKTPVLPTDPSLYICKPSEVDPSVAPVGKENMFILVPCAPGLTITPEQEIAYTKKIIDMIADVCHIPDLASRIEVSTLFHNSDFTERYNAYKGTALGLAHTLLQTAVLRPNNYSKKVKGLYYTGAFTNPGIGTQMCLIAGQLTAERILSGKNS